MPTPYQQVVEHLDALSQTHAHLLIPRTKGEGLAVLAQDLTGLAQQWETLPYQVDENPEVFAQGLKLLQSFYNALAFQGMDDPGKPVESQWSQIKPGLDALTVQFMRLSGVQDYPQGPMQQGEIEARWRRALEWAATYCPNLVRQWVPHEASARHYVQQPHFDASGTQTYSAEESWFKMVAQDLDSLVVPLIEAGYRQDYDPQGKTVLAYAMRDETLQSLIANGTDPLCPTLPARQRLQALQDLWKAHTTELQQGSVAGEYVRQTLARWPARDLRYVWGVMDAQMADTLGTTQVQFFDAACKGIENIVSIQRIPAFATQSGYLPAKSRSEQCKLMGIAFDARKMRLLKPERLNYDTAHCPWIQLRDAFSFSTHRTPINTNAWGQEQMRSALSAIVDRGGILTATFRDVTRFLLDDLRSHYLQPQERSGFLRGLCETHSQNLFENSHKGYNDVLTQLSLKLPDVSQEWSDKDKGCIGLLLLNSKPFRESPPAFLVEWTGNALAQGLIPDHSPYPWALLHLKRANPLLWAQEEARRIEESTAPSVSQRIRRM